MKDSNPYLIVTGAAGFIGSHLVRRLNQMGRTNLVLVDNLKTSEKWKNLVGKSYDQLIPKEELIPWLAQTTLPIEAVLHLGACSSTTESDAGYLHENNTRYSIRLFQIARQKGLRFIYASSAATYGDGALGFKDDEEALEALRPLNMYGYSKHLFDLWLKKHNLLSEAVGLKYFNVFGPNEAHKGRMASAIYHMVPQIKASGKVKLFMSSEPETYVDGGQMRDFVWVDDVARMTLAFLSNNASGIFNVATGIPTTWNDLAKAVFSAMDLEPRIEYIPMPEDLIGKYQNYTAADMTKTQKVLGEAAKPTPIDEAVDTYLKSSLLKGVLW